jgi:hypothetical protein
MVPASFWYTKADDTTSTIFVPEFGGISLAQGLIQCTKKSLMPPCKCYASDRTTLLHAYSRQVVDSKRVFLKTHLRYLPRGLKKKRVQWETILCITSSQWHENGFDVRKSLIPPPLTKVCIK